MFVNLGDTLGHVGKFDRWAGMAALISFWSHALAAALFGSLALWQLRIGRFERGQRLLFGSFLASALWAWSAAIAPGVAALAETARNLLWIALLHALSGSTEAPHPQSQSGVRLVYGAVAATLGLQAIADLVGMVAAVGPAEPLAAAALILRIAAAAGSLVLVHNFYGQAAPSTRPAIRLA